jgi:hypothetical protein
MTDRYDALTVREDKDGKAWFTKIGAMFANRNGEGFTLMLDAVPASTEGQYKIILAVPKAREDRVPDGSRGAPSRGGFKSRPDNLDDQIPFISSDADW